TTERWKPRRPIARRAGLVCLIGSLAACSSSSTHPGSTTKTTTSSSSSSTPKTYKSVGDFFAGDGKPLIAFERETQVIATGTVPQQATCRRLTQDVLPTIVKDPNLLSPLALRIPDAALRAAVDQDVRLKVLVVLGCSLRQQQDGPTWKSVQGFSNDAKRLLAQHGIDI
ncbi:MAG: hypothetical protein QOH10_1450, partial [Actinomycetota bacterium]|nr:hypothetical protein [Actinomycetota bacterium]